MSHQQTTKPPAKAPKKPLIYLVDDEPLLLDLAAVALEPDGFGLKKFRDPALALKTFLRAKAKPALLISDYAMGKMNGLELIEACKRARPELKTILLSGTVGAEIIVNSEVHVDRFISKPYQPANLLKSVHQLLAT